MGLKRIISVLLVIFVLNKTGSGEIRKKFRSRTLKITDEDRDAYVKFHNDVRANVS